MLVFSGFRIPPFEADRATLLACRDSRAAFSDVPPKCILVLLVISKIMYEGRIMNLINLDVFSRRRAPLRAARASGRRGIDQIFDWARFLLGWDSTALSEPRRVRPLQ